jgi:hypothetical protein
MESEVITEGEIIIRIKGESGPIVDFHPECWVSTVVAEMRKVPYEAVKKGRQSLGLSKEDQDARMKLMARHSSLGARIREFNDRLVDGEDNPELPLRIERLKLLQDKLWWDIQEFGGAPSNWKTPPGGEQYLRERKLNANNEQSGGVSDQQRLAV